VLLILYVVTRLVPAPRLLARMALGLGAVTAYEAGFTLWLRATPGKLATALRVAELDRVVIDPLTAWTRGLVTSIASLAVVLSPAALGVMTDSAAGLLLGSTILAIAGGYLLGVVTFPSRRGVADRIAGTIVVPHEAPDPVTRDAVAADDQLDRPAPLTAWGPIAPADVRRRARTARLDSSPLLVVALVAVTLAWTFDLPALAIGLAVAWAVLFVLDETRAIARDGGTVGHRREGLAVLDEATGEAPRRRAALARAVVLAVFWLFPPLLVVLALWMQMARSGRGPHDLVAGTVVVHDPGARGL
jgi:uncharacterized RDD family membrane protein YckC